MCFLDINREIRSSVRFYYDAGRAAFAFPWKRKGCAAGGLSTIILNQGPGLPVQFAGPAWLPAPFPLCPAVRRACPLPTDRAGARKGLNGNAVREGRPSRVRGCPCNCKRRARCTGFPPGKQPLGPCATARQAWEGVHQAVTREPGDLPALGRSCFGPGDGRSTVPSV